MRSHVAAAPLAKLPLLAPRLGIPLPLLNEPLRRIGDQIRDLRGHEWLSDPSPGQPTLGDPQPRRDDIPRMGTVAPQVDEPRGGIALEFIELFPGHRAFLELPRRRWQIHVKLLRRRRGLHHLGLLRLGHRKSVAVRCPGTLARSDAGPASGAIGARPRLRIGGSVLVPADRHSSTFRLVIVPGITVDRWVRTWSERLPKVALLLQPVPAASQATTLLDGQADAGLIRLPVDRDAFDAIPLYTETTVAVVPRDHVITVVEEVTLADLAGEPLLRPLDDVLVWPDATLGAGPEATPPLVVEHPATTAAAVELVAAGAGIVVLPQSLARLYRRKDVTHRTVTDAPTSTVALSWVRERYTDLVEEMIGIARGRTVNSTRGRAPKPGRRRRQ